MPINRCLLDASLCHRLVQCLHGWVLRRSVFTARVYPNWIGRGWLNIAGIELSVLGRQCLDRCISDDETLMREVATWEDGRDGVDVVVDWRFTTADAQINLKHLYPSTQS